MISNSVTSAALEAAASASWQRMQLIANNISNEDTPGYKAKRMEFESILKNELRSKMRFTSSFGDTAQRISKIQPYFYEDDSTEARIDGNNVNIDSEEIELARVQIQYDALMQRIGGHYSQLRYAITGGR